MQEENQTTQPVVITLKENGPIHVRGKVEMRDAAGNIIEVKPAFSLCRCGVSEKKPFCDGAHKTCGFVG